jgi:MFS family permease
MKRLDLSTRRRYCATGSHLMALVDGGQSTDLVLEAENHHVRGHLIGVQLRPSWAKHGRAAEHGGSKTEHIVDHPDIQNDLPREAMLIRIQRVFYIVNAMSVLAHAAYIAVYVLYVRSLKLPDTPSVVIATIIIALLLESVFEILTGQFADRSGRSKAVLYHGLAYLAGSLTFTLPFLFGFFGLPVSQSTILIFFVLIAGQALIILAESLFTGSLEAWLVDSLHHYGFKGHLSKVFARNSLIENSMWLVGGLLSLLLLERYPVAPWIMIAILMMVTILLAAVYMPEPYRLTSTPIGTRIGLLPFLREAISLTTRHRDVMLLTIAFAGGYVLWVGIAYLWVPTYEGISANVKKGDATFPIELAWLVFGTARVGAGILAQVLAARNLFRKSTLVVATLANVIPILFFAYHGVLNPATNLDLLVFLALLMISKAGEETIKPIRTAMLNERIPDGRHRSTILSLSGALGAAFAIAMLAALLATRQILSNAAYLWSLWGLVLLAAISGLICIPAYLLLGRRSSAV